MNKYWKVTYASERERNGRNFRNKDGKMRTMPCFDSLHQEINKRHREKITKVVNGLGNT